MPTRRSKLQIISEVLVRDLPRRAEPRPSADNSPEIHDVVRGGGIWTIVVRPRGRLSGEWSAKTCPRPSQCSVIRVDYILLGHRCGAIRHRFKDIQRQPLLIQTRRDR